MIFEKVLADILNSMIFRFKTIFNLIAKLNLKNDLWTECSISRNIRLIGD